MFFQKSLFGESSAIFLDERDVEISAHQPLPTSHRNR